MTRLVVKQPQEMIAVFGNAHLGGLDQLLRIQERRSASDFVFVTSSKIEVGEYKDGAMWTDRDKFAKGLPRVGLSGVAE